MSKRLRMLIVDDNRDFANMVQECMDACHDIEVVGIAEDGHQAFHMLQQTQPDVLLLDLIMPSMDGMEFLRRTTEQKGSSMIILIVSALGNDKLIRNALALGAQAYFQKPLDIPEVISCIRALSQRLF